MSFSGQRRSTNILTAILASGLSWGAVFACSKGPPPGMVLVQCQNSLREIQRLCMLYADSSGRRAFPHSEKGSIASLQILVDAEGNLPPKLFICPSSVEEPVAVEADGKFQLDEGHCSYAMAPWKILSSDQGESIVAFDRTPCHSGGRNVVHLDGSVELLGEAKFQEVFTAQARARGAAVAPPGSPR